MQEGVDEAQMVFRPTVDMRYRGQAYELGVMLDDGEAAGLREAFHAAHERAYGHAMRERAVEVVNVRLQAVGLVEKPVLRAAPSPDAQAIEASVKAAQVGVKQGGDGETITLYEREQLPVGAQLTGPALVFQFDSTVYVASGWSALVDGYHNLILNSIEPKKAIEEM
ncbi:MAG: hypothetical protein JNJ78_12590 [Anaerolineae bacterium]|nr:hypothetical protein [Anaerolineae bacterium]